MDKRHNKERILIRYCTQCKWLLRAAWMAQELLSTFPDELEEVALAPGQGGVFEVWAGQTLVWSRSRDGGFPDVADLKRRVRDVAAPERALGHLDRSRQAPTSGDAD